MLKVFNEYDLNKYVTSPCVPLTNPLHPTPDEYLDMTRNLRAINLIIRRLPGNLLACLPTFECAYLYGDILRNAFQTTLRKI